MKKENKKLLDQEILALEKLQGKERGADIKYLVEYVKEKEGENGLKELKIELAEHYDFFLPDLEKITDVEWISEVIPHIFLVATVRFFDWKREDIYEIGKNAITYSKTLKMFIKYFTSTKKTIQRIVDDWNNYYSEGNAKLTNFNKNKKKAIIEIKNFKTHPILCIYLSGVITRILEITTGSKHIKVKETKCIFKGDDRHSFELTW